MAADQEDVVRNAVLRFYRDELRGRYELSNVRRFKKFDKISDKQIIRLRDFFMEQIYPVPEERAQLDGAFDRLGLMLRSPKRMQPLMGAALTSLWRLGRQLPAAIGAGRSTIDAYLKTRQLEAEMIAEALRLNYKASDFKKRENMVRLIQAVPEEQVHQLIADIMSLFQALSNVEMLQVAVKFMKECATVMMKRKDLYSAEDLEGVRMGLELLERGLSLFMEVKPEEFPFLIGGINELELDWYQGILAEAAKEG